MQGRADDKCQWKNHKAVLATSRKLHYFEKQLLVCSWAFIMGHHRRAHPELLVIRWTPSDLSSHTVNGPPSSVLR